MSSWNEQAAAEWAAHGVFHGRITPEEWDAGGVWLIGDRWPDGYPGKTSKFFYKSWCSRPEEKYLPGNYEPKDRAKEDQWEFVQVLDGCLECCVEEDRDGVRVTKRFPLERGECVDLQPGPIRYWRFVNRGRSFASGIAFFRKSWLRSPLQPGAGEGYEFRLWKSDQLDRLEHSVNLFRYTIRFVEVLGTGAIHAEVRTLLGEVKHYALGRSEYLFLRRGVKATWQWMEGEPSGIVVYLQ